MAMKIIKTLSVLTFAFLLIAASGCQSVKQPKGSSKGYSTYRFLNTSTSKDGRFEEPSRPVDQAIQTAIRAAFEANGLTFPDAGGELVVAYLIIKQDDVSTTATPTYYGDEFSEIQSLAHKKGVLQAGIPERFERGAIVVDVFDSAQQKLIYRNFAVRDIMGLDESTEMEALIQSAVAEALTPFFK